MSIEAPTSTTSSVRRPRERQNRRTQTNCSILSAVLWSVRSWRKVVGLEGGLEGELEAPPLSRWWVSPASVPVLNTLVA